MTLRSDVDTLQAAQERDAAEIVRLREHMEAMHRLLLEAVERVNEARHEVGQEPWQPVIEPLPLPAHQEGALVLPDRESVPLAQVTEDRSTRVRRADRFRVATEGRQRESEASEEVR